MKLVIEFNPSHRLCRVTFHGRVDNTAAIESYKRMEHAVGELKPETSMLDLAGVSAFEVTPDTMKQLAARPPILADPHLRCVVAPDDVLFGMMRMFQILGEETRQNLHVVRSMAEAYKVLGIEVEPAFQGYETIETGD